MTVYGIKAVNQELGSWGEVRVAEILEARKYQVRVDGGNNYHDIVLDGSTTVEVKTALPSPRKGRRDWWQFNLTKHDGQHAPMEEDVLILRCQYERESYEADHYVIPGGLLPKTLTKINITGGPKEYGGKYCLFLEAWDLLDGVVAVRNLDGKAVPLFEMEKLPF